MIKTTPVIKLRAVALPYPWPRLQGQKGNMAMMASTIMIITIIENVMASPSIDTAVRKMNPIAAA